jgi:hypothetical protein
MGGGGMPQGGGGSWLGIVTARAAALVAAARGRKGEHRLRERGKGGEKKFPRRPK